MKRNTALHRATCLTAACILTSPLSAQVPAYLTDIEQAEATFYSTTYSLVDGVLLAMGVAIALLVLVLLGYLYRIIFKTNGSNTRNRRRFTALGLLLLGLSMAGSSCAVTGRGAIFSHGPAQPAGDRWCPQHYHQADVELPELTRTVGYPVPRLTFCRYCGQQIFRHQH